MSGYRPLCVYTVAFILLICTLLMITRDEPFSHVNTKGYIKPKAVFAKDTFINRSDPEQKASEYVSRNHISKCSLRIPNHNDDIQPFRISVEQLINLSFVETTSANFTTVKIVNHKPFYILCDLLILRIVSHDWSGKPKTYGGDLFRLKIYSENPYSATNPDRIYDFNNGTYLVYFTLRWSGLVKLQMKLIHPVELLPQMQLTLSGKVGLNVTFVGAFESKGVSEEVVCQFVELPEPLCNFSNPRTHGPWFCQHPKDPRLTCKDWVFHKMHKGVYLKFEDNLSPLSKALFEKSHMVEVKNNCTVIVTNRTTSDMIYADLAQPFCSIRDPIPTSIVAAGHFFNNNWYSNDCKVSKFTPAQTMTCLRNKRLIIVGDSTIRQIFNFFRFGYNKYFRTLPEPKGVTPGLGPIDIKSEKYNTSIYFHFHGLPMTGPSLVLRREFVQFTAGILDSIESGSEIVVILSLWAHFTSSGKDFYVQRMKSIKSAIQRFLDRCPTSKVIIKGANTKDYQAVWITVISSEWSIVEHEIALRALFQDEERVGFIDALDITRAQPYPDAIHPHEKIIQEFVNRILTYLCKN